MEWSERLVRTYVEDETVTLVLSQTNAVEAAREERLAVSVELFRGWCLALPATNPNRRPHACLYRNHGRNSQIIAIQPSQYWRS